MSKQYFMSTGIAIYHHTSLSDLVVAWRLPGCIHSNHACCPSVIVSDPRDWLMVPYCQWASAQHTCAGIPQWAEGFKARALLHSAYPISIQSKHRASMLAGTHNLSHRTHHTYTGSTPHLTA